VTSIRAECDPSRRNALGWERGAGGLPATIEEIEEALVACHELWRRSPGEGRWPFAGDGPWHLAQGEVGDVAGDYSETLIHTDAGKELRVRKVDARRPRCPLDAGEVALRDRVTAWLQRVPDPADRRAVWLATLALHREQGRVPWTAVARAIGWARTPAALALRYRRVLAALVCALNGWPSRRAKVLAGLGRMDAG
jgi:hypothetical protein